MAPITNDKEILRLVRNHHEHYNGVGYPDGLKDTQIELGARILAIADAYDAMTSERPYREAMSDESACDEIERCKGTQFDPIIVEAFLVSFRNVQEIQEVSTKQADRRELKFLVNVGCK